MKKFQLCALLLIGFALITQTACKKDNKSDDPDTANQNKYVNDWIYENMKDYYYWTDDIPANPNKAQSPDAFFASLLKKPDDRFSWIQDNYEDLLASLAGVNKESGLEYGLFVVTGSGGVRYLAAIVEYVKKGSPAEAQGIVRGDVFVQVNGKNTSYTGNQSEVNAFVDQLSKPHTLGIHKILKATNGQDSLSDPRNVQLQVVEMAENPVYLDSVYSIGGQKIGYFVYNFFAPDKGDNSADYDKEVDAVFAGFKQAGVQHLILDLRYNPGGDARSTQNLGSNIVKGLAANKLFFSRKMNKALEAAYIKEYGENSLKTFFTIEPNNIGNQLTSLIILTSSGTASASELIINGLRPYMPVYLIGDVTYGKNVGSISLYEENDPRNKWGMQPITSKAYNSLNQSDYSEGFAPDEKYEETLYLGTLGNIQEPMLAKALTKILGHAPARKSLSAPAGSRTFVDRVGTSRSFKAYSNQVVHQHPKN